MTQPSLLDLLGTSPILLDGAIGTELMRRGLPQGACLELWNVDRPETVAAVHADYFAAGSDAVLTNSFGGSAIKLAGHGLGSRAAELNSAAARVAVSVKPVGRFVGGSMGPTGKFLQPQGDLTEPELRAAFEVQARSLAEGGVDFFLIETMYDLREALAAVRAARTAGGGLPVLATLTFNRTKRGFFTLMGDGLEKCARALEAEGVPALGANCSLASSDMADLVAELRAVTRLPIIAQANAGRPELRGEGEVVYSQGIEAYLADVPRLVANGAAIVGGCCGTDPEYIRRMAEALRAPGRPSPSASS